MITEFRSTLKEPRFNATCRHCNDSFGDFTWADLINHLAEHEVGIHFKDIKVKTSIVADEPEYKKCICCNHEMGKCDCIE